MFERLNVCPSCGTAQFKNKFICKDYSISKEDFAIMECQECQLLFTNPRPTKVEITKYYESKDYISHSNKSFSLIDLLYKLVRNITLNQKLKLINKISTGRSLLDYGCGTGHFLNKAYTNGWTVQGIEPSKTARENTQHNLQQLIASDIGKISDNESYDIITLWHVLEHIHNLNDTLGKLKGHLNSKGKMLLAVPNHESFDATYYAGHWAGYDVPRHLYHFSQNSMTKLLKRHGIKIESILPMRFDAYYVSMLSEQYKTNSKNYIKSFINGYKSNSYANKTGQYSSLIYVTSLK